MNQVLHFFEQPQISTDYFADLVNDLKQQEILQIINNAEFMAIVGNQEEDAYIYIILCRLSGTVDEQKAMVKACLNGGFRHWLTVTTHESMDNAVILPSLLDYHYRRLTEWQQDQCSNEQYVEALDDTICKFLILFNRGYIELESNDLSVGTPFLIALMLIGEVKKITREKYDDIVGKLGFYTESQVLFLQQQLARQVIDDRPQLVQTPTEVKMTTVIGMIAKINEAYSAKLIETEKYVDDVNRVIDLFMNTIGRGLDFDRNDHEALLKYIVGCPVEMVLMLIYSMDSLPFVVYMKLCDTLYKQRWLSQGHIDVCIKIAGMYHYPGCNTIVDMVEVVDVLDTLGYTLIFKKYERGYMISHPQNGWADVIMHYIWVENRV